MGMGRGVRRVNLGWASHAFATFSSDKGTLSEQHWLRILGGSSEVCGWGGRALSVCECVYTHAFVREVVRVRVIRQLVKR